MKKSELQSCSIWSRTKCLYKIPLHPSLYNLVMIFKFFYQDRRNSAGSIGYHLSVPHYTYSQSFQSDICFCKIVKRKSFPTRSRAERDDTSIYQETTPEIQTQGFHGTLRRAHPQPKSIAARGIGPSHGHQGRSSGEFPSTRRPNRPPYTAGGTAGGASRRR